MAPRVQDFLITIAAPVSRPTLLHEYRLTTHSLYAAISMGLNTKDIVNVLDRFLKNQMPPNVVEYIMRRGKSYGKVKMVLRDNEYFVETADLEVLQFLLKDASSGRPRNFYHKRSDHGRTRHRRNEGGCQYARGRRARQEQIETGPDGTRSHGRDGIRCIRRGW